MSQELDDDHPLWLVNEQIKGLLEGDGATEDHENVLSFLRSTGLPDDTVRRMHKSIVHGDSKISTIESLKKNITECTAAFLRLKEVVRANHEFRLRSDPSASGDFSKGFYKGSGACVMNEDALALPDNSTEVLDKYTKPLNDQLAAQALTIKTMREALEKFIDSHEECTDFDGFTAQVVSMDDYHKAQEALAIPDNSTEILQDWLDKQLGDPVAFIRVSDEEDRLDGRDYEGHSLTNFVDPCGFQVFRKPEIK